MQVRRPFLGPFLILFPQQPTGVGVVVPILRMRKPRLGEVEQWSCVVGFGESSTWEKAAQQSGQSRVGQLLEACTGTGFEPSVAA